MTYSPEYLSDLMVRMAHHSTAIEGNTLTQGETKSVLVDGYVPRAMDMRELNEVLNYKAFMTFLVEQSAAGIPLSLTQSSAGMQSKVSPVNSSSARI